jgi:hypothetical protein
MIETRKCEECSEVIIKGYIDIEAPASAEKPRRTLRLHSNGGCLGKYREKHPLPPRK